MTKQTLRALAALILMPVPMLVAGTKAKESKKVVEKAPATESFISGDLGVTVASQYISRGVVNENQGFIAQPYADLYFKLYEGDGFLNKVQLNLGLWSSLHSKKTGATAGTTLPAWYEFDWMPGISFTFAKNFNFTVTYFDFDFVSSGGRAGIQSGRNETALTNVAAACKTESLAFPFDTADFDAVPAIVDAA